MGACQSKKTAPAALSQKQRNQTILLKDASETVHSIIASKKKQRNQPTVMLKVAEDNEKPIIDSKKELTQPIAAARDTRKSLVVSKSKSVGSLLSQSYPPGATKETKLISRSYTSGALKKNKAFKLNPVVQHDAEKHAARVNRMLSRRDRMRSLEPTRCVEPGSNHRLGSDHFKRVMKGKRASRTWIRNMSEKLDECNIEDEIRTLSMAVSPQHKDPNFFNMGFSSPVLDPNTLDKKKSINKDFSRSVGQLPGLEQYNTEREDTIRSMLAKHYLFSPLKKTEIEKLSWGTMVRKSCQLMDACATYTFMHFWSSSTK